MSFNKHRGSFVVEEQIQTSFLLYPSPLKVQLVTTLDWTRTNPTDQLTDYQLTYSLTLLMYIQLVILLTDLIITPNIKTLQCYVIPISADTTSQLFSFNILFTADFKTTCQSYFEIRYVLCTLLTFNANLLLRSQTRFFS